MLPGDDEGDGPDVPVDEGDDEVVVPVDDEEGIGVLLDVQERPAAPADGTNVLSDVNERPREAAPDVTAEAPAAVEAEERAAAAGQLAFTGARHQQLALFALILLGSGGLLLLTPRRLAASRAVDSQDA